jgi:hypothetical protein
MRPGHRNGLFWWKGVECFMARERLLRSYQSVFLRMPLRFRFLKETAEAKWRSMREETLPQMAFLGFAEHSELVHDGETNLLKWNTDSRHYPKQDRFSIHDL